MHIYVEDTYLIYNNIRWHLIHNSNAHKLKKNTFDHNYFIMYVYYNYYSF
jgi:hypothetical protein